MTNLRVSYTENSVSRCKPLLGTYVEISISGMASDRYLLDQSEKAYKAIELVQSTMSFHDSSSELSIINQQALCQPVALSKNMYKILSKVDEFNHDSSGLFDPSIAPALISSEMLPRTLGTISYRINGDNYGSWRDVVLEHRSIRFRKPVLLDLGGIAKGFAVDQALAAIDPELTIVINAGGDIAMNHWQNQSVGIYFGTRDSRAIKQISMKNSCLATSASYLNEQQSVIIDPLSGCAKESNNTYSVFAPNCMTADALTKLIWLEGVDSKLMKQHHASSSIIDQYGFYVSQLQK